jgi:LPS sulfotransferase NodH
MKPPVFIVGCPRSGTTWLYHILLSSGGFAIYRNEPKIFTYLAPLFGGFRSHAQRERFLQKWLASEDFDRSGLEAAEFRRRFLAGCRSAGDCLRLIMESIASQQGAERWSDCTPDNLLLMDSIQRAFPDARFIHCVRDGRDVALSLAQQAWIRPLAGDRAVPAVIPAALYWAWAVARGRALGERLGSAYLEIRYEDLVRTPQAVLDRIAAFLDHPLDYARIQQTGIGSVKRPNTSFAGAIRTEGFQPLERWRKACPPEQLGRIEALVGDRLEELGYRLAVSPAVRLTAADRLRRWLYPWNFRARLWLRIHSPLARYFSDASLLEFRPPLDEADKTLRPGLHREFIRRYVAGER